MSTPDEVRRILAQLEPILTRWYNDGTKGDVAVVCGENQMQPEERPVFKHDRVEIKRTLSRAKLLSRVR
jgi:hypothetical protein